MQEFEKSKSINSSNSLVLTHPTTNLPPHGLSTAERTGALFPFQLMKKTETSLSMPRFNHCTQLSTKFSESMVSSSLWMIQNKFSSCEISFLDNLPDMSSIEVHCELGELPCEAVRILPRSIARKENLGLPQTL